MAGGAAWMGKCWALRQVRTESGIDSKGSGKLQMPCKEWRGRGRRKGRRGGLFLIVLISFTGSSFCKFALVYLIIGMYLHSIYNGVSYCGKIYITQSLLFLSLLVQ